MDDHSVSGIFTFLKSLIESNVVLKKTTSQSSDLHHNHSSDNAVNVDLRNIGENMLYTKQEQDQWWKMI